MALTVAFTVSLAILDQRYQLPSLVRALGLVGAIVGLALLGPLMAALTGAFAHVPQRFAAVVTLSVTASGVAAFGIGAAFWGLCMGIIIYSVERLTRHS